MGSPRARVADPLQPQRQKPEPPPLLRPHLLLHALPLLELLQLVALLLGEAGVVAVVVRESRQVELIRPAPQLLQRCSSSVFSSLPSFLFNLVVFAKNFLHVFFFFAFFFFLK